MQDNLPGNQDPWNDEALIERWRARQEQLSQLLRSWGALEAERNLDWSNGFVQWRESPDDILVTAEMKALCIYYHEDESLQMAWANDAAGEAAAIDPVEGVPEVVEPCPEADAWVWAMQLAEASGADYLYPLAAQDYRLFLGLWNLSPSLPDEPSESGAPQLFVLELLDELRMALGNRRMEPAALRRLFLNHGESLQQNAGYLAQDGLDSDLLQHTASALIAAGRSFGQRRFGILPPTPLTDEEVEELKRQVSRLGASWVYSSRRQK
jgi:hypothetical protein